MMEVLQTASQYESLVLQYIHTYIFDRPKSRFLIEGGKSKEISMNGGWDPKSTNAHALNPWRFLNNPGIKRKEGVLIYSKATPLCHYHAYKSAILTLIPQKAPQIIIPRQHLPETNEIKERILAPLTSSLIGP